VIDAIAVEMRTQLQLITRSARRLSGCLENGFLAIEVKNLAQAAEMANYVAPEHLELLVADAAAKKLTTDITTAGAIMIGNHTPTALGDFVPPDRATCCRRAGPGASSAACAWPIFNAAPASCTYDRASVRRKPNRVVAAFAAMEKLDAHGRSVRIRT
jgi:histidinol dehydrogenase